MHNWLEIHNGECHGFLTSLYSDTLKQGFQKLGTSFLVILGTFFPKGKLGQEPGFNRSNGIGHPTFYIYVV